MNKIMRYPLIVVAMILSLLQLIIALLYGILGYLADKCMNISDNEDARFIRALAAIKKSSEDNL